MMKDFPRKFVLKIDQEFPAVTIEARRPSDAAWNDAFLRTVTVQLVFDFPCQTAWSGTSDSGTIGAEMGPTSFDRWERCSRRFEEFERRN